MVVVQYLATRPRACLALLILAAISVEETSVLDHTSKVREILHTFEFCDIDGDGCGASERGAGWNSTFVFPRLMVRQDCLDASESMICKSQSSAKSTSGMKLVIAFVLAFSLRRSRMERRSDSGCKHPVPSPVLSPS